jgi:hypothetical protein
MSICNRSSIFLADMLWLAMITYADFEYSEESAFLTRKDCQEMHDSCLPRWKKSMTRDLFDHGSPPGLTSVKPELPSKPCRASDYEAP